MLLTRQTTLAGVIRKTTSSLSLTSLPSHLHSLSLSLTPSLTGRRIFLRIRNHRRIRLWFFNRWIGRRPDLAWTCRSCTIATATISFAISAPGISASQGLWGISRRKSLLLLSILNAEIRLVLISKKINKGFYFLGWKEKRKEKKIHMFVFLLLWSVGYWCRRMMLPRSKMVWFLFLFRCLWIIFFCAVNLFGAVSLVWVTFARDMVAEYGKFA